MLNIHSGQALPNSPEWMFNIGANYRHPNGIFGGVNYRWEDESYSEISAAEQTRKSGRRILDAKLGYRFDGWTIYLWATNLLDEDHETWVAPNGVIGTMNTPRRVGLGLEYDW